MARGPRNPDQAMATPPFDLSLAIHQWRCGFTQATPVRGESIDELEAHLRDSVAALQHTGLTPEEAFLVASRRLGPAEALTAELAKVRPADVRRTRVGWMLVGVFVFILISDLANLVSSVTMLLGHGWSSDGLRLGWLGVVAKGLALTAATLALLSVVFGRRSWLRRVGNRCLSKPSNLAAALLSAVFAVKLAAGVMPVLLARQMSPISLGGVYAVLGWGGVATQVLFLAALAAAFVRFASQLVAPARALAALIIAGLLISQGVTTRSEAQTPAASAVGARTTERATLDHAMKLWQAGRKDDALKEFAAVDFTRRPLFPKGSVLAYSEKEFMALPRAVNEKVHPQILAEIRPLKGLAIHVKEAGAAAAQRGDQALADKYLQQLRRCGEALEHPDSLALLQAVGRGFKRSFLK